VKATVAPAAMWALPVVISQQGLSVRIPDPGSDTESAGRSGERHSRSGNHFVVGHKNERNLAAALDAAGYVEASSSDGVDARSGDVMSPSERAQSPSNKTRLSQGWWSRP
jgi:hypothetical protein